MTPYATLDDLISRFPRELTEAEEALAPILLGDASFWISVWVPGLQEAVDGGDEVVTEAAKLLVVAMVRRTLLEPQAQDGVSQLVVGPFQVVFRAEDYGKEIEDITGLLRSSRADAVSYRSPGL